MCLHTWQINVSDSENVSEILYTHSYRLYIEFSLSFNYSIILNVICPALLVYCIVYIVTLFAAATNTFRPEDK